MSKTELARFKAKGDWNNIGKIREWEFVIERFDTPGSSGVLTKVFDEEGKEINFVSFNPFAHGAEIDTAHLNTCWFEEHGHKSNTPRSSLHSKANYTSGHGLAYLEKKAAQLDTLREAFEILKGDEE